VGRGAERAARRIRRDHGAPVTFAMSSAPGWPGEIYRVKCSSEARRKTRVLSTHPWSSGRIPACQTKKMALTAVSYVLYSKTTAVTRRVYRNLLTANAVQYAGDPRYERPTGPRVCPRLARVEPVESQEWQLTGPCLQYAQFDSRRMQASLFFVVSDDERGCPRTQYAARYVTLQRR